MSLGKNLLWRTDLIYVHITRIVIFIDTFNKYKYNNILNARDRLIKALLTRRVRSISLRVWEMKNKMRKLIIMIDNSCNDWLLWYRMAVIFYQRKGFCALKPVALPDEKVCTLILSSIFPTAYMHIFYA